MPFSMPRLDAEPLSSAKDCRFTAAPGDGVLPDGFFSTSNLPTWVKRGGKWEMPLRPRMDGCVVDRAASLQVIEARKVRAGERVACAMKEDGSEGVVVHDGFREDEPAEKFRFMSTPVSRERPVSYEKLADSLKRERDAEGYLVWSLGPAVVHARAREDIEWFIRNGYVSAMLAGNALAAHDIESAMFGTALGVDAKGQPVESGHGMHLRAINEVRRLGGINKTIEAGKLTSGVMHTLVTQEVPFVLAGSIRDDGPLPEVFTDNLAAQDAMREHTAQATGAVLVATSLHAIAIGNQLPAFHTARGGIEPLLTICVDQTEFVVNKLKDRGTHQAFGVVTNAQDFLALLRTALEK
jgi:lysine-ketoglutarate reductase/saccharopine dehydrogenase-like protein (TIGR00300 family)